MHARTHARAHTRTHSRTDGCAIDLDILTEAELLQSVEGVRHCTHKRITWALYQLRAQDCMTASTRTHNTPTQQAKTKHADTASTHTTRQHSNHKHNTPTQQARANDLRALWHSWALYHNG